MRFRPIRRLAITLGAATLALNLLAPSSMPAKAATGLQACWDLIAAGFDPSTIEIAYNFMTGPYKACVGELTDPTEDAVAIGLIAAGLTAGHDQCMATLEGPADKAIAAALKVSIGQVSPSLDSQLTQIAEGTANDELDTLIKGFGVDLDCACAIAGSGVGEKIKDVADDVVSCGDALGDAFEALGSLLITALGDVFDSWFGEPQNCAPLDLDGLQTGLCGDGVHWSQEFANCGTPWYLPSCDCPQGAQYLGDPNAPGNFVCECPSGQGYVNLANGISTCLQCPPNATAPGDGACQCNVKGQQVQVNYVNQTTCGQGGNGTAGGCVEGFGVPVATCRCPSDTQGAMNGECRDCPSGCSAGPTSISFSSSKQGADGTCSISTGYTQQCAAGQKGAQQAPNSCSCVPACDFGQVQDTAGSPCHFCGDISVAAGGSAGLTYTTGIPVYAKAGSSIGSCQACPGNKVWYLQPGFAPSCQCPPGTISDSCTPFAQCTNSWQHLDALSNTCVDNCPRGQQYLGTKSSDNQKIKDAKGDQYICQACGGDLTTIGNVCAVCPSGSTPDGNGGCSNVCGNNARYVSLAPTELQKKKSQPDAQTNQAELQAAIHAPHRCDACPAGQHANPDDPTTCVNFCAAGFYFSTTVMPTAGTTTVNSNSKFGTVAGLTAKSLCLPCASGKTDPNDATKCVPPRGVVTLPANAPVPPPGVTQMKPNAPTQGLLAICGGNDVALPDGSCCPANAVSADGRSCIATRGAPMLVPAAPQRGVVVSPQTPSRRVVVPPRHAKTLPPAARAPHLRPIPRRCRVIGGRTVCR
jgi:hypothetical protein